MEDMLWKDRKRHLGLPISFTKYSLSGGEAPRIFRETGLFNLKEEEVLLYRVRDITLTRSFFQRIFGVGTLDLVNISKSKDVKELIFSKVEQAKANRRMRTTELLDDPEGLEDGMDN